MASITIRKLDESVKAKLRVRAAHHGRSMEEEVREILKCVLIAEEPRPQNLAQGHPQASRAARRRRSRLTGETACQTAASIELMIVLDTNVLSEALKPSPDELVFRWLAVQRRELVVTTAITQAEILYGVAPLPGGKRRSRVQAAIER